MWQAESGWQTWLEGRLRRSCTYLLSSSVVWVAFRRQGGDHDRSANWGFLFIAMMGRLWYGGIAHTSLPHGGIISEFPQMLGNPTWKVLYRSHFNEPPDLWSLGDRLLRAYIYLEPSSCTVLRLRLRLRLRHGFGPGQRTEQRLHPRLAISLGGSASWSMGPSQFAAERERLA